jgi:hypothetical protein
MPWQGEVNTVKPLNEVVMVYGDGGCTALAPYNQEIGSTYGTVVLDKLGELGVPLANRGAVGGGDQAHFFIDDSGEAWFVGGDLSVERLGYSEFFSGMLANTIIVSYDPEVREFHIADGTDAYVWNGRLSKSPQMPTSIHFTQGGLVGVVTDVADPDTVTVTTNIIDFGTRRLKQIKHVNLSTSDTDPTGWTMDLEWRLAKNDSFTTLSGQTFWPDGTGALVAVSGVEFRFTFTASDRDLVDLDRVDVEWEDNMGKMGLARII